MVRDAVPVVAGVGSTVSVGPRVSSVTERTTVVVFPSRSVATIVMVLGPATRVTTVLNAPAAPTVTAVPLTVTDWMPFGSVAVPDMVRDAVAVVAGVGSTVSVGPMLSSTMVRTTVIVFPSRSVATIVMVLGPATRVTTMLNV